MARKPGTVIPVLEVAWFRDEVALDGSVQGVVIREETRSSVEISSTITVDSARVVDSGLYTCSVVVNIPESEALSVTQAANVTINGTID